MINISKQQITQKITSLSDGNDQLGELLSYCIGRLCLNSTKDGNDWRKELNSIDVPHIVDWLKAAIINDEAWLKNVDEKNRPKKLMKFGSFEDVQKEADKAMIKANQQNSDIKLIDGDEELYMQLEDGYHLVKLLTPAALDREGSQMQHCIGGGAYDEALNGKKRNFLSLRDGFGNPHITLEVVNDSLTQLQGKQNKTPNIKYTKALKPFFAKAKLMINIPINELGYVISTEGNAYDIDNLPKGLKVSGDLDLYETTIASLPDNLVVGGYLNLSGTPIKSLPEGLEVGGGLYLSETPVTSLPKGLKVGGDLHLYQTSITSFPEGLKVTGDLNLYGTPMQSLPEGLEVDFDLNLGESHIKSLPKGLKVGGDLNVCGTLIDSLPEGLEVGGDLNLEGTLIDSLPEGLEVGGDLIIEGTLIQYLPDDIKIGGSLDLRETIIQSLPEGLEVGGEVYGLEKQNKSSHSSN